MAIIHIEQLNKSFGALHILKNINLTINSGEFLVFVGPSGCGKSTLLRIIAGLERASSGTILFDGERVNDTAPADRRVAMVFQSYALYPHMSVYENIAFPLQNQKLSRQAVEKRVNEVAALLQLSPLLSRLPKNLSGGQRQRVAIGRAIARDPKVFLFDEPLSNLDAALRVQMRIEISKLKADLPQTTMIYVTHDQVEAMTMADRIVVLNGGHVEQVGSPLDLYNSPCNEFVAGFIGSPRMNFMKSHVLKHEKDIAHIELPGGNIFKHPYKNLQTGAQVTVGLRPEHVLIDKKGVIPAHITRVEQLGESFLLYSSLEDGSEFLIKGQDQTTINPGDKVMLGFAAHHVHVFSAEQIRL